MGCNLLQTFGFNFAKCLTFHTNKQQLITLSRTAQSKGCSAASRTCFTHMQLQQHGPRNYPLYSSLRLRAQPREDTGLSPAKAVFGAPLSKNVLNPCMFLPLLCLGTILSPTCPASCQPSCSLPPSSGSVGAAWFHSFSRSTTSPTGFYATAPTPSPSKSGRRTSQSAALRPARQLTPCLAARHTAADRRTHAQAVLPQPRGSRFQTHWFLHLLLLQHCHETVPEPFSYLARRFLHLLDRRHLHSLNRRGTRPVNGHHPRGWTSDLFSSQPRPDLRGALWRAAYAPGDGQISPAYSSQPVQCLYINCLLSVNKPVLSYLLLHLVPHIVGYRWNRRF